MPDFGCVNYYPPYFVTFVHFLFFLRSGGVTYNLAASTCNYVHNARDPHDFNSKRGVLSFSFIIYKERVRAGTPLYTRACMRMCKAIFCTILPLSSPLNTTNLAIFMAYISTVSTLYLLFFSSSRVS